MRRGRLEWRMRQRAETNSRRAKGRTDTGSGEFRSLVEIRRPARARARELQESPARCAGLRGGRRPRRRNRAGRRRSRRRSRNRTKSSVIGGDRLSLAGATMLNGFLITAVTMCDTHRSTLTHITPEVMPPALAIAERDGLSGRDLLVALVAGMETMTRIGIGTRLSGVPRARLARPRRARAVRRRRGGRPLARLRRRDDGEGVRPRRQPVRRHVRGLGHADGEIPSVPRRAVGSDGGVARRAEIPGDDASSSPPRTAASTTATPTAESPSWRLPISASAGSSSRSRCGCGRRRRRPRP